jgi:mannosyltransferase OCH1-like enzyme
MKNPELLISIASYCDDELIKTINSLLENAADKNNLDIIVFNQSEYPENINHKNVTEVYSNYKTTNGVVWAREQIRNYVKPHHKYYLQIDAHMRFDKGFDEKLISHHNDYDGKVVFSGFPSMYYLPDDKSWDACYINKVDKVDEKGRFWPGAQGVEEKKYLGPSTIAAGYFFSDIEVLDLDIYQQKGDMYFEETYATFNTFLAGYDITNIPFPGIYHLYDKTNQRQKYHPNQGNPRLVGLKNDVRTIQDFNKLYGTSYRPNIIHQVAPQDKNRWSKEWFRCDYSWDTIKGYKRNKWCDRDGINTYLKRYDKDFYEILNQCPVIYKIDFVRYLIARDIGGVICDMDFEVYNDFTKQLDSHSIYLLESSAGDEDYQNGFIVSPPSDLWNMFLESLKANIINNLPDILNKKEIEGRPLGTFVRQMVGPIALSEFIKQYNIPHKVLPYAQFNPVGKFNFDFIQTYHYGTGNWGGGL